MSKKDILIVDDDELVCHSLKEMLNLEGYTVDATLDSLEALSKIDQNDYSLIISDIRMPNLDGVELLKEIRGKRNDALVIFITGHGNIDGAVEAIKLGAYDYVSKPIDDIRFKLTIKRALEQKQLLTSFKKLQKKVRPWDLDDRLVIQDRKMEDLMRTVHMVADTMATVLITGESGTGKSMLARYIHRHSSRREGPFIELSCGMLAETLLESELFGHVKGAFTGAHRDKKGKFEEAQSGTIFLDDINCASINCQIKLLRVLQDRVFERVGGNETISTDVRIITATNTPLIQEVEKGRFREDLFHRINVVSFVIPPLRERLGDIEPLIEFFIKRYNEIHKKRVKGITKSALQLCYNYDWPGNVRQLENLVERAVILAPGDFITPESFPEEMHHPPDKKEPEKGLTLAEALAEAEKRILLSYLNLYNWNRQLTARRLGISRTTLFNKMRQYQIEDHRRSEPS